MLPAPAPNLTRAILRRTAAIWLMMKLVVTGGAMAVQEAGIEQPLRAALQLAPFAALALAAGPVLLAEVILGAAL